MSSSSSSSISSPGVATIKPIFRNKKLSGNDNNRSNNNNNNSSDDDIKQALEDIREDLMALHQSLQSMLQMVDSVGHPRRDSRRLRRAISSAKTRSLDMSRTIHLQLTEVGNETRSSSSSSYGAYVDKLQNDYKKLLARQQIIYQQLADKEQQFPARDLPPSDADRAQQHDTSVQQELQEQQQQQQQQQQQMMMMKQTDDAHHIILQESLDPLIIDEYDYAMMDEESERQMQLIEEDMDELVEIFQTLDSSVQEQEALLVDAEKEITQAQRKVHHGTKQLKSAHKYAAAGLMVAGGIAGVLVGGPVGAVAGIHIAGLTAGVGLAGGAVIGLTGGLGMGMASKKIMNRINAANARDSNQKPKAAEKSNVDTRRPLSSRWSSIRSKMPWRSRQSTSSDHDQR